MRVAGTWAMAAILAVGAVACDGGGGDASGAPPASAPPAPPELPAPDPAVAGEQLEWSGLALRDVWVDGARGDDANDGTSEAAAYRTVDAAWRSVAASGSGPSGVRLRLAAGSYPAEALPNYWESVHGTAGAPIVLEPASAAADVTFSSAINAYDVRYVYFVGFTVRPAGGGDAFHCERCDHVLLRGMHLDGGNHEESHEVLKVNQSSAFFVEDSDIHTANDNAIDFVAVQGGHVTGSRIHDADDWCAYAKGGSADIRFEGNTLYDCGTGGFTAGQGTSSQFLVEPYLRYEAERIVFTGNVVRDVEGAAVGVNGGSQVRIAGNTFVRVGRRSHLIEVLPGLRDCIGADPRCDEHRRAGGWVPPGEDEAVTVPNGEVVIEGNVLWNPPGWRAEGTVLSVQGRFDPPDGANVPVPARGDGGLHITANTIWDGGAGLGLLDERGGCRDPESSCSEAQLRADNAIDTVEPDVGALRG